MGRSAWPSLPLALFSAGGPIGTIFAMIACGWLEQRVGWRLESTGIDLSGPKSKE